MGKIKNYLAIFAVVVIAIGATYLITKWNAESKIEYVRDNMQQRIDSISVVKQAVVARRSAIEDSLRALDEKFADYILRTDQEINDYTTIIGRLRLQKDRLEDSTHTLQRRLSLAQFINQDSSVTNTFKDTLISRTETWSDSLFATDAIVEFSNDSLSVDSQLRQLRNIRIDVVNTVSDDRRQVNTFVRSPDFDSLKVTTVTEITPPKKKPWGWGLAGILLIKEAVQLLIK